MSGYPKTLTHPQTGETHVVTDYEDEVRWQKNGFRPIEQEKSATLHLKKRDGDNPANRPH